MLDFLKRLKVISTNICAHIKLYVILWASYYVLRNEF